MSSPRDAQLRFRDLFLLSVHPPRLLDYVQALEEEQRKIEVFKRELPVCMQLISEAVALLKAQLCSAAESTSISLLKLACNSDESAEESLPSRRVSSDDEEEAAGGGERGAAAWNNLWTTADRPMSSKASAVRPQAKHALPAALGSGGAFSPFVRKNEDVDHHPVSPTTSVQERSSEMLQRERRKSCAAAAATAAAAAPNTTNLDNTDDSKMNASTKDEHQPHAEATSSGGSNSQQRKSRRCWSPELHRRFVGALEQLGGSHVATPKQIREIMKVEGLTNDEVKSHLQKYRLHTRRMPSAGGSSSMMHGAPQHAAHAPHGGQLVVLGWVPPPDFASSSSPAFYTHINSTVLHATTAATAAPPALPAQAAASSPPPPPSPTQVAAAAVPAAIHTQAEQMQQRDEEEQQEQDDPTGGDESSQDSGEDTL